ncbi:MAG: hypothetical protein LKI88_00430 [Bifidobacterium sp.]|jgi:hypothetical protein|nr:hypothetical protein [Bifidobacterium sp.]MCI1864398.1 hypothetical protein [Bifidobacterium sp.]
MTEPNNSNEHGERPPHPTPHGGDDAGSPVDGAGNGQEDLTTAWAAFEQDHAHDLRDIAHSHSAKRFENHARRKEKEALLSVSDLDEGSFTDDARPRPKGPRDFSSGSWLDVDDTMNRYGADFVPPHPRIGHVASTVVVLWAMFILGVLGIIVTVFVPSYATVMGTVCGVLLLIGASGLLLRHRDKKPHDADDDGARV